MIQLKHPALRTHGEPGSVQVIQYLGCIQLVTPSLSTSLSENEARTIADALHNAAKDAREYKITGGRK